MFVLIFIIEIQPCSIQIIWYEFQIDGYVIIVSALIGIPVAITGIYGVHKEHYTINIVMTVLTVIGLVVALMSGVKIAVFCIQLVLAGCQIYYTIKIKKLKEYSAEQTMNQGMNQGNVKPNESTAIIMDAYKQ